MLARLEVGVGGLEGQRAGEDDLEHLGDEGTLELLDGAGEVGEALDRVQDLFEVHLVDLDAPADLRRRFGDVLVVRPAVLEARARADRHLHLVRLPELVEDDLGLGPLGVERGDEEPLLQKLEGDEEGCPRPLLGHEPHRLDLRWDAYGDEVKVGEGELFGAALRVGFLSFAPLLVKLLLEILWLEHGYL